MNTKRLKRKHLQRKTFQRKTLLLLLLLVTPVRGTAGECEWGSTLSATKQTGLALWNSDSLSWRTTYSSTDPDLMNGRTVEENFALCKEDCENNYQCAGVLFYEATNLDQRCVLKIGTETSTSIGYSTVLVTCDRSSCPKDYPYVFSNGDKCCANDAEGTNGTVGELCDGGHIGVNSSCCLDDAFLDCGETPCSNYQFPCNAGEYRNSSMEECSNCTTNTVSESEASSCTACDPGLVANHDKTQCVPCDAGEFWDSSIEECSNCTTNTVSESGASSCTACDPGSVANDDNTQCGHNNETATKPSNETGVSITSKPVFWALAGIALTIILAGFGYVRRYTAGTCCRNSPIM